MILRKEDDIRIAESANIKLIDSAKFGKHISIDDWVYISTQLTLGDYIHIAPQVCIIGGKDASLIMEDFTSISAGCRIICASDDFTQGMLNPTVPIQYRNVINKPVTFKRFSAIGVNCVVMPGVTIAEGSVVGAGSFVTQDTIPWAVYSGNPARALKQRDKELILKAYKELGYE